MTLRGFAASCLLAAAAVAPALADAGKAPVQVSVQVVRSCRVTTDQPQVSVTCSTGAQPVQVTYAGAPAVSAPSVTIHF
jgi:hypothetical protein